MCLPALLFLIPAVATASDYKPDKYSVEIAEDYCAELALMAKPLDDAAEIIRNVQAKVAGRYVEGDKAVYVVFPYNTNGAGFACMFRDYSRGRLQLMEFGELWPERETVTRVKQLY